MPRVALLVCAVFLLRAAPARAADFTVNTTEDHPADGCDSECTVRDALAIANADPDPDFITIPAGIYNLASALKVTETVTISGDGSTLDTSGHDRVLDVTGGSVRISSVRIARGQSPDSTGGSGVLMRGGELMLDRVTLDGNSNNLQGGALLQQAGKLTINDSEITGNHGTSAGGLYIAGGETNVDRTLWLSNDGGAIDNAGGTLTVTNSTFAANLINAGHGGAIYAKSATTLRNVTFEANVASGNNGGGSALWADVPVTTANVLFGDTGYGDSCAGVAPHELGGSVDAGTSCGLAASGRTVLLGPLAANEGPARSLLPYAGSAGINAGADGECTATDQRLKPRPRSIADPCDTGAIEGAGGDAPPPLLDDEGVHDVGVDSAQVDVGIDRRGLKTAFHVEYGTTTAYRSTADGGDVDFGPGAGMQSQTVSLTDLQPNTTYHYRFITTSAGGTTVGQDQTFETAGPASFVVASTADEADGSCTGDAPAFTCTSLRAAVEVANAHPGADAVFLKTPGAYTLTQGELELTDDVTLAGQGARSTSIQAGAGARALEVMYGVTAAITHLTVAGGDMGTDGNGGNILDQGTLVVDESRITGGRAVEGGGIAIAGEGTAVITASLIDHNTGSSAGGGIAVLGTSALTAANSTIAYNAGGGISVEDAAEAVLVGVTSAGNDGGGFRLDQPQDATIYGSIVADGCTALQPNDGGGNLERGSDCGFPAHGVDPELSDGLVDAGGETDVFTIQVTSPAVGIVSPCMQADDQRGFPRDPGVCDAGAYEQTASVAITAGPDGYTTTPDAQFTFVSDQPGEFECSLQGPGLSGDFAGCLSPKDYVLEREGDYTFSVHRIGSSDPATTRVFTFDRTAPEAPVVSSPAEGEVLGSGQLTVSGTTEPGAQVELLDGDEPVGSAEGSREGRWSAPVELAEGSHSLRARATDAAGNTSPLSPARTFRIGVAPAPAPAVTSGPPETTTDTSAAFEFSAGGAAGFECRLDGPAGAGTFQPCASPKTYGNLAPGAYTFTVRSLNDAGTPSTETASRAFSVAVAPAQTAAPTPTPTPGPQPTPTPQPGKTVVGAPVSGKVLVKKPGGKGYVEVGAAQGIPLGSTVDARKGVIELTAKAGQTARFSDGIFKVTQTRTTTDLTLTEPLAPCGKRARAAAAKAKKPKTRKLWGEGTGSFRTRGQYSAATVRGTKWLVQDSCTGTLTRVAKGVVEVRDQVKRKTLVVRAGKSYLAKPKR